MNPEPDPTTVPAGPRPTTDGVTVTRVADAHERPSTDTDVIALAPPGYTLGREIGRGGMGVVFHATQRGLNRPVALKMLLAASKPDARELARFFAEAEAVAAVKHPHVVQVYEFGEHLGRPFLAMEYLPGGSLADRLKADGRPTPHAAAELVARLARAIQAAHESGVIHRDLKPGNVLFDAAGEPRVCDFGLAKRGDADLTRTNAVMGTPAYMAPEQARGKTKFVGPAADVYALGVVLFEMLCGRRPFEHEDAVELILQVAEAPVPPVRRFNKAVARDLDLVCQKCLAKEPADRYPTAAALAADLTRFANGEPVSVGRLNVLDRLRSTLGRSKNTAEFAEYAHVFLWMAGVVLVGSIVSTLCVQGHLEIFLIRVVHFAEVGALFALLYAYRRGHWFPNAGGELYLWAVWGGFIACFWVNGLAHQLRYDWEADVVERRLRQAKLFQTNALLSALAFLAMAPVFWGWFYAFGVLFLAVDLLMAVTLKWAPLEFGVAWAAILGVTGYRLRKLARR